MNTVHKERRGVDWIATGVGATVVMALMLGLYKETVMYLVSVWNQWKLGDYGHGYLVLAISCYLVFKRRKALAAVRPCPNAVALVPVALASVTWLLATMTDVQIVQAAALVGLLIATLWAIQGNQATRIMLFPLMFLFLAQPIWSLLAPPLQDVTASAVFFLARLLDIPALREESFIVLPAGKLAIEEACSGLRFVLAAATLGALFAYLNYSQLRYRVAIVLLAVVAAILLNIVRVLVVVILAYQSDMQHPLVDDHLALGWYMFGGMLVALLLVEYLLHRLGWIGPAAGKGTGAVSPVAKDAAPCGQGAGKHVAVALAVLLLAAAGPLTIEYIKDAEAVTPVPETLLFPDSGGGWSGPHPAEDSWHPLFPGAREFRRAYTSSGGVVYLYVAFYSRQQQGRELINDVNSLTGAGEWTTEFVSKRPLKIGGENVLWQRIRSERGTQRILYYWYNVAGIRTTDIYMAKLLQLYGMLTGRNAAAVLVLATDVHAEDADSAHRVMEDFLLSHRLTLNGLVPDGR